MTWLRLVKIVKRHIIVYGHLDLDLVSLTVTHHHPEGRFVLPVTLYILYLVLYAISEPIAHIIIVIPVTVLRHFLVSGTVW